MANPYTEILSVMRNQGGLDNTPGCMMGVVTAEKPLKVSVAGLDLDKDDLLAAEWLIKDWNREWEIESGTAQTGDGTIGISGGKVKIKPKEAYWKKGDKLLLIPEASEQAGFQRFFIIAKLAEVE